LPSVGPERHVEVGRGHRTGRLLAEGEGHRVVVVELHDEFLEMQDDLHHVLGDAGDGRELVQHVLDVDAGHRRARHRGEQDAPQRVAEGDAVAAGQRLHHELAVGVGRLGLEFGDDLHRGLRPDQRE
jgi:hypothetical protein